MEDYVYVLDYLPEGRGDTPSYKRIPIVYGLGEDQFTILELLPKSGVTFVIGEKIYVGKDTERREKVAKIKGRIDYDRLTATAHGEMPYIIEDIVRANEEKYVKFFNEAPAISTRFHSLELLPGLGKKILFEILDERKKRPFESFEDIANRIPFLKHPEKIITKRIEIELTDPTQKYHLFTRPPPRSHA
jgi:putative nucleotide binding protein